MVEKINDTRRLATRILVTAVGAFVTSAAFAQFSIDIDLSTVPKPLPASCTADLVFGSFNVMQNPGISGLIFWSDGYCVASKARVMNNDKATLACLADDFMSKELGFQLCESTKRFNEQVAINIASGKRLDGLEQDLAATTARLKALELCVATKQPCRP